MDDNKIADATPTAPTLEVMRSMVEDYLKPGISLVPGPNGIEIPYIIHGSGLTTHEVTLEQMERHSLTPFIRRGTAALQTVDSLIGHTLRFASPETAIFANSDRLKPSLTTVFDYHDSGAGGTPRKLAHRATFAFPLSDEWLAWTKQDKNVMTMTDFARFLEDNVTDVLTGTDGLDPHQKQFLDATGGSVASANMLLTLSKNLKINETSGVKETRNLSSGEAQIEFVNTQETEIKGDIVKVPSAFIIAIPVFKNALDAYRLLARLRTRKEGASIKFWFELWRVQPTFDTAFTEACAKVADATKLPLFYGTPEA